MSQRIRMLALALMSICLVAAGPADAPPSRGPLRERPLRVITPRDEFFVIQHGATPKINLDEWRLRVEGLVSSSLTLSIKDLQAMKQVEEPVTIECIENPPGGGLIGTGRWRGVLLKDVLRKAGVKGTPDTVVFRAADGYQEGIPYRFLERSPVMLVTHLNGKPLPPEQGYPVRVIAPGLYGLKNIKWVESVRLIRGEYEGFWARRGWSNTAEARVKSWIYRIDRADDSPNDRVIRGVAYAGLDKVTKVEVSLDGGKTWRTAAVDKPVGPYAWSVWSYRWVSPVEGSHRLAVRATDSRGETQPVVDQNYRDGNNGMQSVTYTCPG